MERSIPKFSYIEESFDGERWILLLPGNGCSWAKTNGGCYMCGFGKAIREANKGKLISHEELMDIYQYGKLLVTDSPKKLVIYNGGSFLNDEEIPVATQLQISAEVAESETIEELFVESRPEFVAKDKLQPVIAALNGKKLKIGIGLECQDDEIRKAFVNKGFSRYEYEAAVKALKEADASILTYVLLKPIGLTEREAIDEAVKTIEYAFNVGSDEVALESAFVQEGTRMHSRYQRGQFRPPWLWSIIQVLQRSHHLGPVYLGGFDDEPPPIDIPRNCSECSPLIMSLLSQYRKTHDITLFTGVECGCRAKWGMD